MTNRSQHLVPDDGSPWTPGTLASTFGDAMSAQVAAAIVQAVVGMLSTPAAAVSQPVDDPAAMLTVGQAAALLGISRMTVTRKADAGELPCVVVSRGTRQKMRRFPRALIEHLATCGGGSAEVDLKDYADLWLAQNAGRADIGGA